MHIRQHYSFIVFMEPFQNLTQVKVYKRKLGFVNVIVNTSRKIWFFQKDDWDAKVTMDIIQQVTVKFTFNSKSFIISTIYAIYNVNDRQELWDELQSIRPTGDISWIVRGDFNVILNEDERWVACLLSNRKLRTLHIASIVVHLWKLISQGVISLGGMVELRMIVFLKDQTRFLSIILLQTAFLLLKYYTS